MGTTATAVVAEAPEGEEQSDADRLRSAGLDTVVAASTASLCARVDRADADCAVVAHAPPTINAVEAAEAVDGTAPVVVVADGDEALAAAAVAAGADRYVPRGCGPDLVDAVRDIVGTDRGSTPTGRQSDAESSGKTMIAADRVAEINEAGSALLSVDEVEEIRALAVQTAEAVLPFDVCTYATARDGGRRFVSTAVAGDPEEGDYYEETGDRGAVGRTYREGETILFDPADADAEAPGPYRTVLSLAVGDHGVFQAASREPDAFDETDIELAELLFSHVREALGRAKTELAVRAERDRLSALFDSVPHPALRTRILPDGTVTVDAVNDAFESVFGYGRNRILDRSPVDLIVPGEGSTERSETVVEMVARGESVTREVPRRTASGIHEFELSVVPAGTTDDDETVAFALYRDVTTRNRRRRRLSVLNRVLRHDVRNAMNVVGGYARSIAGVVDDEEVAEWARVVVDRSEDLLAMAERARSAERVLEPGDADVERRDLATALRSAASRLRQDHPRTTVAVSAPRQVLVPVDPEVDLAVGQLVENAIKHADEEAPAVAVVLTDDGDAARLRVSGGAPGVPPGDQAVLAGRRPIDQLNHTSGLGLWLVKWVVGRTGGQLTFEDDGRTVVVTLPRSARQTDSRISEATD